MSSTSYYLVCGDIMPLAPCSARLPPDRLWARPRAAAGGVYGLPPVLPQHRRGASYWRMGGEAACPSPTLARSVPEGAADAVLRACTLLHTRPSRPSPRHWQVKVNLVRAAIALTMKALGFVGGRHSARTAAFVKSAFAFIAITIPGIDNPFARMVGGVSGGAVLASQAWLCLNIRDMLRPDCCPFLPSSNAGPLPRGGHSGAAQRSRVTGRHAAAGAGAGAALAVLLTLAAAFERHSSSCPPAGAA